AGNTKFGEFGNYSNDWQTLELVFTAGSATVTPKLNGVAGPAFQVIKDSLTLGLNALTLTDITKNAAYGVEIESLVLEINAPASS
ncbi:9-O-acetyl-N-acetylneuraminic acid deacetylase, partial [Escherichia marmotae]|nr:9-O-acetyl-N-acetylneuraminic acid deacetylase [Escherichia marmotae]